MDTSQYDAPIQAAAAEKAALFEQVEAACEAYIQASTNFFRDHFRERIEAAITDKPQITQSLGVEKLRELKSELKEIIDKCPEIVSEHLNKPNLWEHRNPIPEGIERGYSPGFDLYYKAGDKAHEELREILGTIGQLLLKYGFVSTGKDHEWESRPNAVPRYKYGLTTSDEIGAAMKKYKDLFEKFIKAHTKELQLEREKQEAIAKDLWNQA